MSVIALTGATGFVGSHVLEQALSAGHGVRALTRRMGGGQLASGQPQPLWIEGTLESPAALAMLCDGADAVIHIAGAVNVPTRDAFAAANIAGTEAVLAAAQAAGVKRFIHVSSLAAREPGLSNYGWSKAGAEQAVRASALSHCIVRPPAIYGPRDGDMFEIFAMARRGIILLPPAGRASLIHVQDLAALLVQLAMVPDFPAGALFEVDDGTPGGLTHRALAAAIAAATGRPKAKTISAPKWLLHLAGRGDRLVRSAKAKLTPDRAAYMAHPDWVADPTLRPPPSLWQPAIPHETGLKDTAKWYQAHGWFG